MIDLKHSNCFFDFYEYSSEVSAKKTWDSIKFIWLRDLASQPPSLLASQLPSFYRLKPIILIGKI
jgi:hypothetical protein